MGFANYNGVQHGFYKIDYLTIWNRDGGLPINAACLGALTFLNTVYPCVAAPVYAAALSLIPSKQWDIERSAVLVAAPTTANRVYDTNHLNYFAHDYYAAAHEYNVAFDQSSYFMPIVPTQNKVVLHIALSKHATYFFNPNMHILTRPWLQAAAYNAVNMLWATQVISQMEHMQISILLFDIFGFCLVDRFLSGGVQSVSHPSRRTNIVGLNITQHDKINEKLTSAIWGGFQ
jgi:hypothetical protein